MLSKKSNLLTFSKFKNNDAVLCLKFHSTKAYKCYYSGLLHPRPIIGRIFSRAFFFILRENMPRLLFEPRPI